MRIVLFEVIDDELQVFVIVGKLVQDCLPVDPIEIGIEIEVGRSEVLSFVL